MPRVDILTCGTASPDVEFCAYTIPHPSEAKMNVRIQTYGEAIFPLAIKSAPRLTISNRGSGGRRPPEGPP